MAKTAKRRIPPTLTPAEEEAAAKRKQRANEKRAKAAEQRSQAGRNDTIREVLADARKNNLKCECPIRMNMTLEELLRMQTCTEHGFGGRTGTGWVCPVTDRIRRRLGH